MESIPFNRLHLAGRELDYMAESVLTHGHISGDGPFTLRCQDWLERTLGTSMALLTHSCTAALEMSALLCDIGPGDEILMPSFTFVSTANAFVLRGGMPVFVDIRKDTLNLDERLLSGAITSRTRAIVPVHYAGEPCEMQTITDVAREHGLWVIEDAAQGYLSSWRGRHLGTIGDLGCLSFHQTKNVVSGEGGALLVNAPGLLERAEVIREKGTDRKKFLRGETEKYTWVDLGSSYLPGDITAAFLYAQLEKGRQINQARQKLLGRYLQGLAPLGQKGVIALPGFGGQGNGHVMYIIAASRQERAALMDFLRTKGIQAVFHYAPLHLSAMGQRHCRVHGTMDNTESLSQRLLRLPLYCGMHNEEVDRVVQAVKDFFSGSSG